MRLRLDIDEAADEADDGDRIVVLLAAGMSGDDG